MLVEFFDDGDAKDDSEDAIEGSGVGYCVEMRADDEAGCVSDGGEPQAAKVADGVDCALSFRRPPSIASTSEWTACMGGVRKRRVISPGTSVWVAISRQRTMMRVAQSVFVPVMVALYCYFIEFHDLRRTRASMYPWARR